MTTGECSDLLIHSIRRSGTHLLMASIYNNFVLPDMSREIESNFRTFNGIETKGKVKGPWFKLFGGHYAGNAVRVGKDIFIYRHPVKCFYSLWVFSNEPPVEQWLSKKNLLHWKSEIEKVQKSGILAIRYEDLINRFSWVMEQIQGYTGLTPKREPYKPLERPVGWNAFESGKGTFPDQTLQFMREILGNPIFDYQI